MLCAALLHCVFMVCQLHLVRQTRKLAFMNLATLSVPFLPLLLYIMLSYTLFWNTSWVDLVKNLSLNIQTAVTEVLLLKITNRKYSFTQCIKTLKHSLCFWTSLMGASCIQAQAILKKLLTYKNSANQLVFELIMLCVIVQGLDVHQWHMEHQRRLDLFELIETDHLFISISILGAEVTTAHSST